MSRRFQFSLKWLLVVVGAICIVLGLRQVYLAHFANFIVAESPAANEPIRLRGQVYFRDGADGTSFSVWIVKTSRPYHRYFETRVPVKRSGIGTYRFSTKLKAPWGAARWGPGAYQLVLEPYNGDVVTGQVKISP